MDDLSKLSQGLGGAGGGADGGADGGTGATGGAATGATGGTSGTSLPDLAAMGGLASAVQQSGGLDGLIDKLRGAGLGDEVDSWVANGENKAVDPQRLGAALGPDTVQKLSIGSGIDVTSLLPMLAAFLPQIISMLTPKGEAPEGGLDNAVGSGGLGDLGGLLGGLMGAGSGGATGGTGGLDDLLGGLSGMLGGDKGR
jgi:uncharacterized protein YidB (DUF937 family)